MMEPGAAGRGKGARRAPARPQPKEEWEADGRGGDEGSPRGPRGEGPRRPRKAGAGPGGRKASQKPGDGATPPRGAQPLGAASHPAGKPRVSRARQQEPRLDPRKTEPAAAPSPPRAPGGEAQPPAGGRGARAAGGGQKKRDGAGRPEKGSGAEGKKRASRTKRQEEEEEEEEEGAPQGTRPRGAGAAAAREVPDAGPGRNGGRGPPSPPSSSSSSSPPDPQKEKLKLVLEKLKLAKEARSAASRLVNSLRDRLVKEIKTKGCFKSIEILGTGSYYERVKICSPNEFDIMLKIPSVRVELEPYEACTTSGASSNAASDAYCYVKLKRDPKKKELMEFCHDERLSSSKMLFRLRSIITEEVKKIKDMTVSVERKKSGSPAITLLIGSPPSVISVDIILGLEIPYSTRCGGREHGMSIEEWLGTKVKKSLSSEPLYLVPKNIKEGQCFIDNTWRLSFSKIEKMLLNDHGSSKTCCESKGVKCCRKDSLKLLKYLLEQLKTKHENRNQFNKFNSYQVKTVFFHACVKWPKDDDWLAANLGECFRRLLNYFLDCLKEAKLPHFFIPTFNLFAEKKTERTKCNALVKAIDREINNGFPIFLN